MLKFTQRSKDLHPVRADLLQRVEDLDEWQSALVLSFINQLFGPEAVPAEEMEVAA